MLVQYRVQYRGMTDTVILYLNMYDPDTCLLPAPERFVLYIVPVDADRTIKRFSIAPTKQFRYPLLPSQLVRRHRRKPL